MSEAPRTLLFVYGTLKRGGANHAVLARHSFVGEARTAPGFALYHLGEYPGLVAAPNRRTEITGEVWAVDAAGLAELDAFEGIAEGLYRREPIALQPPFAGQRVETYFYNRDIAGWPEIPEGNWK